MQSSIRAGFDGFEVGGRQQLAARLAAMSAGSEPVLFLVVPYRRGVWLLDDQEVTRHLSVDDARTQAERACGPGRVLGVLGVVPCDGGLLYAHALVGGTQ